MDTNLSKPVSSALTILDIVSAYPETETIFRRYDEQIGGCICCQSLFETVEQVAEKNNLDLVELLKALNLVITN